MTKECPKSNRREFLRAGLATAAAATAVSAVPAQAQQKLPQAMIMYQSTPRDGLKCVDCQHWQPPAACAIVEGTISPNGWCGAFAPKG